MSIQRKVKRKQPGPGFERQSPIPIFLSVTLNASPNLNDNEANSNSIQNCSGLLSINALEKVTLHFVTLRKVQFLYSPTPTNTEV